MEGSNLKKSKNWKKRFSSSNSYYSFFTSFLLAFFCSFLCNYIDSPLKKIFTSWEILSDPFLDLICYNRVNYCISIFISLLSAFSLSSSRSELDSSFLVKFLKSNLYCLIKIYFIFDHINSSFVSQKQKLFSLLVAYFFYFFSNYLIETIVVEIEKRGIFSGENLIYLLGNYHVVSKIITSLNVFEKASNSSFNFGLKSNEKIFTSFFIFIVFWIFILMSKLRWSFPVENNNFYYPFEDYEEKPKFLIDFRLNPYIVQNVQLLFDIFKLFLSMTRPSVYKYLYDKGLGILFSLSNFSKHLLLFFFITLLQIPYIYFVESKELAYELSKKGVYFDEVSFNKRTKNFLFLKMMQTFLIKSFILWGLTLSFKILFDDESFSIIFFISQLIYVLEQSENYWKFMVFYE